MPAESFRRAAQCFGACLHLRAGTCHRGVEKKALRFEVLCNNRRIASFKCSLNASLIFGVCYVVFLGLTMLYLLIININISSTFPSRKYY